MSIAFIAGEVRRIQKKHGETDPRRLAKSMGVLFQLMPMGTYEGACKGFCMVQSRVKAITVNSELPDELQRIIAAHELGHIVLHRNAMSVRAFHEFALFDNTDLMEYEANIFAAELLLPDDQVLEKLNGDMSFYTAAAELQVPAELLDFKFRILKRRGYNFIDPPLMARGAFLKNLDT